MTSKPLVRLGDHKKGDEFGDGVSDPTLYWHIELDYGDEGTIFCYAMSELPPDDLIRELENCQRLRGFRRTLRTMRISPAQVPPDTGVIVRSGALNVAKGDVRFYGVNDPTT